MNSKKIRRFHRPCDLKECGGFSVPELLVSVFIISLVTAVVVYNQKDFNDQIALNNAANEIDIQIREAQVYGVSVKESLPGTSDFSSAYGVEFNIGSGGSNNSFLSYVDFDKDGIFDGTFTSCTPGPSSECIRSNLLTQGVTITHACAILSNNSIDCSGGTGPVVRVSATFLRPDPNARLVFINNGGSTVPFPNHIGARITITSPKGTTRNINIYANGQVAIQ